MTSEMEVKNSSFADSPNTAYNMCPLQRWTRERRCASVDSTLCSKLRTTLAKSHSFEPKCLRQIEEVKLKTELSMLLCSTHFCSLAPELPFQRRTLDSRHNLFRSEFLLRELVLRKIRMRIQRSWTTMKKLIRSLSNSIYPPWEETKQGLGKLQWSWLAIWPIKYTNIQKV